MKVVVIGGGPAGMLAAISSAKENNQVVLLEKNKMLGKKLLITGKGRCNITSSLDIEEFIKNELFTPFVQADNSPRSDYNGTGLGMPIVKQLVEKMGGTITVESKLGEGSCFTVILPFKIDTNARPEEKEDFNADLSGVRILLVEDNELNAEIAEFMLTENGAKVETVKNGLEAVQHFEASEPGTYDVILMDVMMPVMDGLTATKTIRSLERQDAKTIPIIAMTANAFREDAEKCMEAGMNAHLAKPLDDKTIKQTICEELRSSRDR